MTSDDSWTDRSGEVPASPPPAYPPEPPPPPAYPPEPPPQPFAQPQSPYPPAQPFTPPQSQYPPAQAYVMPPGQYQPPPGPYSPPGQYLQPLPPAPGQYPQPPFPYEQTPYGQTPGYPPPPAGPPPVWPPTGFVPQPAIPPTKKRTTSGRVVVALFLVITLLGLAGVIVASVTAPSPSESIANALEEIERDVARLRELAWKQPVKKLIVTPGELAERVRKLSREEETATAQTSGGQEQMLKFLQLIPQQMDLKQYTEELFASGVIGYYDTETKEIVVGAPPGKINSYTKVTLAHELVHALEDQHFDFESIEKRLEAGNDSEAEAAFTAVVEGSATLAMVMYARTYLSRGELNEVAEESEGSASEIDTAPAILKDSIMFPYEQGMDFVSDFQSSGGWTAVNKLYKDLPVNTEQIMNPARYEQREVPPPISVAESTPTAAVPCARADAGTVGARDMATTLKEGAARKEAGDAADAWNGDAYRFDVCGSEKVFQLKIRGDDAAGTRDMLAAWEAYGKSWTEGKVRYAPKGDNAALRGTALVKAKDDYIAVVLSSDSTLASTSMASL